MQFFSSNDKHYIKDPRNLEVSTGLLSIAYGSEFIYSSTMEDDWKYFIAAQVFESSIIGGLCGIIAGSLQLFFTFAHKFSDKRSFLRCRIMATFLEMFFWLVIFWNFYELPGFRIATIAYTWNTCANVYVAFVLMLRLVNDR